MSLWNDFLDEIAKLKSPHVLELGTHRSEKDRPTTSRPLLLSRNPECVHVGLDIEKGEDVDIVADAHKLADVFSPKSLDAFIGRSVLEHFRRPWVVAEQLARVLKPGGIGYIQTHQTFPVHAYPHDYFRFTTDALGEVFAEEWGWKVVKKEHEFPCRILPLDNLWAHAVSWNFEAEAWLNANVMVRLEKK